MERTLLSEIWTAAGGAPQQPAAVRFTGAPILTSSYAVSALASASIGAAGLAVAELTGVVGDGVVGDGVVGDDSASDDVVTVDRTLADAWFAWTLAPQGWQLPQLWDDIAGDYRAADGWIRLHTNDPRHRAVALAVLQLGPDSGRADVGATVSTWSAGDLESQIVAAGGCAAQLHSPPEWSSHPQGRAVAGEPLIDVESRAAEPMRVWAPDPRRPLAGIRVLDLTRVLAGPVATRFMAGLGAEVLRIDPPWRDETGIEVETSLGKHCARLELREPAGRDQLLALLAEADVLVHGYRPGALEGLGLGQAERQATNPGLVEASLCAYGWTGPWRERRGFDSLVQMSSGIAAPAGPDSVSPEPGSQPTPLPVQALDHAAGYVLATAAIRGLHRRRVDGRASTSRTSLARVAALLAAAGPVPPSETTTVSWADATDEPTAWGPGRRLPGPVRIGPAHLYWTRPAAPLGSAPLAWPSPRPDETVRR